MEFSPRLRQKLSHLRRSSSKIVVASPDPDRPAGFAGAPRGWHEDACLVDPPPLTEIETARGPVHIRTMRLSLPAGLRDRLPGFATGPGDGRAALFFDTETLGLGSQTVFLAGLARVAEGAVAIEQVFARDYSREAALLMRLAGHVRAAARVVTFNGRSYDIPLVRDRAIRHRVPLPAPVEDIDLLHRARRVWGKTLPDCRLLTLEFEVLGRARQGDIPGREIPQRYRDAVRSGDVRPLAPVFHHNALDLLTMIELAPHLADDAIAGGPERDDGGVEPPRP